MRLDAVRSYRKHERKIKRDMVTHIYRYVSRLRARVMKWMRRNGEREINNRDGRVTAEKYVDGSQRSSVHWSWAAAAAILAAVAKFLTVPWMRCVLHHPHLPSCLFLATKSRSSAPAKVELSSRWYLDISHTYKRWRSFSTGLNTRRGELWSEDGLVVQQHVIVQQSTSEISFKCNPQEGQTTSGAEHQEVHACSEGLIQTQ